MQAADFLNIDSCHCTKSQSPGRFSAAVFSSTPHEKAPAQCLVGAFFYLLQRVTKFLAVTFGRVLPIVLFQVRLPVQVVNCTFWAADCERLTRRYQRVECSVSRTDNVQEETRIATFGLASDGPTAKANAGSCSTGSDIVHLDFSFRVVLGGKFLHCLRLHPTWLNAKGAAQGKVLPDDGTTNSALTRSILV